MQFEYNYPTSHPTHKPWQMRIRWSKFGSINLQCALTLVKMVKKSTNASFSQQIVLFFLNAHTNIHTPPLFNKYKDSNWTTTIINHPHWTTTELTPTPSLDSSPFATQVRAFLEPNVDSRYALHLAPPPHSPISTTWRLP